MKALEATLAELTQKVQEDEAARVKDAQATGKRVYALEERIRTLEEGMASRARARCTPGWGRKAPWEASPWSGRLLLRQENTLRPG